MLRRFKQVERALWFVALSGLSQGLQLLLMHVLAARQAAQAALH